MGWLLSKNKYVTLEGSYSIWLGQIIKNIFHKECHMKHEGPNMEPTEDGLYAAH